jgi:hypothetical protein
LAEGIVPCFAGQVLIADTPVAVQVEQSTFAASCHRVAEVVVVDTAACFESKFQEGSLLEHFPCHLVHPIESFHLSYPYFQSHLKHWLEGWGMYVLDQFQGVARLDEGPMNVVDQVNGHLLKSSSSDGGVDAAKEDQVLESASDFVPVSVAQQLP